MHTIAQELRQHATKVKPGAPVPLNQDEQISAAINELVTTVSKALACLALPATLEYLRTRAQEGETVISLATGRISWSTPLKDESRNKSRAKQLPLDTLIRHAADQIGPIIEMLLNELPGDSLTLNEWQHKAPSHKRESFVQTLVMESVSKQLAALLQAPGYGFTKVSAKEVTP